MDGKPSLFLWLSFFLSERNEQLVKDIQIRTLPKSRSNMDKVKLYVYPHAPSHIHDTILEYRDKVPFSEDGIARHCEIVPPEEADYFYCGQFHDNVAWMLHPNRFEFFKGRESHHIYDIEGDWRNIEIPEWLSGSLLTAMDAYPKHRYWNLMVRPGMSHLLANMMYRDVIQCNSERIPFKKRTKRFVFMGQLDSMGLRARMLTALERSGCPSVVRVNQGWGAQQSPESEFVGSYEDAMRTSTFALCPCGEGIGVRFLEALYYGTIPILIDDHVPFCADDFQLNQFYFHIGAHVSEDEMVRALRSIFMSHDQGIASISGEGQYCFDTYVRAYLVDPTQYFLDWAKIRGVMP